MHPFSSQVGKGSISQNLLTDLLMIFFTVAMSTVCSSFKGTPSKAPPTEDINEELSSFITHMPVDKLKR